MTKEELINRFCRNHQALTDYVAALPEDAFHFSHNGKWTAGQQLDHVYRCLKPIAQALNSREYIVNTFGKIDRPTLSYDEVIDRYKAALASGGKAPERFVPGPADTVDKAGLLAGMPVLLQTIKGLLESYSDGELDTLVLPHPLLGKLTIRELFYLMTYHAVHHHQQVMNHLALSTVNGSAAAGC